MLVNVDANNENHLLFLYRILKERYTSDKNINTLLSFSELPTFQQHCLWWKKDKIGYYYLWSENAIFKAHTLLRPYRNDLWEIGIFVLREHYRKRVGTKAIESVIQKHLDKKIVAIINSQNKKSQIFFSSLGFKCKELVYELSRSYSNSF